MSLFSKTDVKSDIVLRKGGKIPSCISCKLYKSGCQTPKMEIGNDTKAVKNILIVLDFPNVEEDNAGSYLSSKSGGYLKALLGKDLFKQCLITSALRCSPKENENPDAFQIDSCRTFMLKNISLYKPKLILVFGKYALQSVIGNIWQDDLDKIDKWRGYIIPDQTHKAFIAPTYNIDEALSSKNAILKVLLKQDIEAALRALNEPFPIWKEPNITVLKSLNRLYDVLKPGSITAFDYETTGLKPHSEGHKIISASIAVDADSVYTFKFPQTPDKQEPFVWYLKNKLIRKAAHNMKYEEAWSYNILGVRVKGWYMDSMQMAHVFDNRRGITSLKFQGYIFFGITNYNIEVEHFLKGVDPDNANSKNRIEEFIRNPRNLEHLLHYNALDSIVEYRLMLLQQEQLKNILPF